MKKHLIFLSFIFLICSSLEVGFAQEQRKVVGYWDLSYNFLLNTPKDTLVTTVEGGGSIKWSLGFLRRFYKNKFYVGTGLFLNLTDLKFQKPSYLSVDRDSLFVFFIEDSSKQFGKTKLQTIAFQIPLMFGFHLNKVFFEVGGFGSVVLFSKQKQKYTQKFGENKEGKVVVTYRGKDYTGINILQYGLTARVSYKSFGLFINYYLNPYFNTKNYTDPQLIQVGISFNNFSYNDSND